MILDDVKKVLRITNTAFDTEITDLIAAARQDLIISGILEAKANDDADPLIKRAIQIYCKANFGWDNPDSESLQQSYVSLKMHLSLAEEYNTEVVVV
jgi:uncharacterized phage protein (predicted DNA packaging)